MVSWCLLVGREALEEGVKARLAAREVCGCGVDGGEDEEGADAAHLRAPAHVEGCVVGAALVAVGVGVVLSPADVAVARVERARVAVKDLEVFDDAAAESVDGARRDVLLGEAGRGGPEAQLDREGAEVISVAVIAQDEEVSVGDAGLLRV